MLFNSLIFTIFLPLVFAGYWLLPARWRNYWLLFASYYFYFSYKPAFLILLIATSAFDYWCAKKIYQKPEHKKFFLVLSLLSNLGILFAFKYFVFFYNSTASFVHPTAQLLEQIVIPAGLSFYTFQSLSYTIDIYRGRYHPKDTLAEFLLFVSFFPHMVAGPVVRYDSLMPQLKSPGNFKTINWSGFATLTTWGYFKKLVIADNLNLLVTPVFNNVTDYSSTELLLAGFLFVIQLYCDFSGYSDIAVGVARLFGIELSINFRRPLLSRSLIEFWKRNHISITSWFRDYLYVGVGGNRVSTARWIFNLVLVFFVSGLWHGANTTFIIWGLLHGLVYSAEKIIKKQFPGYQAPALIANLYLLLFHTLALIAFRSNSLTDMIFIYKSIFTFQSGYFHLNSLLALQDSLFYVMIVFCMMVLLVKELHEEYAVFMRLPMAYGLLNKLFYPALVILLFLLGNFSSNTFIYFQF